MQIPTSCVRCGGVQFCPIGQAPIAVQANTDACQRHTDALRFFRPFAPEELPAPDSLL